MGHFPLVVNRRHAGLLLLIALPAFLFLGMCQARGDRYLPPSQVWRKAVELGERHGIEPGFIYAIAFAESSFKAGAVNGDARGLMQMTRPAWNRVTDRPFHHAWDWEQNMEAAVDYLGILRKELEKAEAFSYPMLAASYRYGRTKMQSLDYDLGRLPYVNNNVYRAIFNGDEPIVPAPLVDENALAGEPVAIRVDGEG